jgi:hypothetical protein
LPMDPVTLAYPVAQITCPGCGVAFSELFMHPAVGIPVGILLICVLILVVRRARRASKRLTGTAQVLSVETMTKTEGRDSADLRWIALRVEIPGRPTYDATAADVYLDPDELAATQPGKTVSVTVGFADPQDVWIDFSQPIT